MLLAETTNDEVVAKTTAITTAISNLEFAGLANLNAAIAEADTKFEINYTALSWADLDTAMLLPETTNAEIVTKTTAINDAIDNLVINTNLTSLTKKINNQYFDKSRRSILNLNSDDYTESTWNAYILIITSAKNLEYNENTLQSDVNDIINCLDEAIDDLEFAGLEDLNTAKGVVLGLTEADYTVASWTPLATALVLSETTNNEIVIKTTAINSAVEYLITVVADLALTEAEGIVGELTEVDYTTTSWEEVDTAMLLTETTNAEVVAKATAINNAIEELEFAGLANLNTAKTAITALTEVDYTTTSWADIDTAMLLPETTNAEVVAKTTAINDAIEELVFAGLADLNTAKTAVTALTEADYTTTSWEEVDTASALPEITNAEIVTKTTAINDAVEELVFAGLANLNTAKALAATKVQSHYTTTSWTPLATALALPETTNDEVVAKTTAINTGISNLVIVAQPVLKYGSKGTAVTTLQQILVSKGYTLAIDGSFGPQTLRIVKAFQAANKLVVDGSVGPKTWAKLLQ